MAKNKCQDGQSALPRIKGDTKRPHEKATAKHQINKCKKDIGRNRKRLTTNSVKKGAQRIHSNIQFGRNNAHRPNWRLPCQLKQWEQVHYGASGIRWQLYWRRTDERPNRRINDKSLPDPVDTNHCIKISKAKHSCVR